MFCREQVAQLIEWHPRFVAAGAQIVVVGNGSPEEARVFAEERHIPFRLLTDPSLRTYEAAGMRRSVWESVNPGVIRRGQATVARGFRQGATQGSLFQNGGAFLILPDGTIPWAQVSKESGDHFDPAEPLARLAGASPG